MKKFFKNIDKWQMLSYLLLVVAIVMGGGGAMADATQTQIGDEGGDDMNKSKTTGTKTGPASEHDPVNPDENDRQMPGGNASGQNLDGTQASATQMRDGGLEEEEREQNVTLLYPQRTPLLTILSKIKNRRPTNGYIVKHARVGGETLDGVITSAIAAGTTVTLTTSNFSGNLRAFRKHDTIMAPTVGGYKAGSKTEHDGCGLMLEVMEVTKSGVVLQAINGPAAVAGQTGDEYDYQTVPALAAGTYLMDMLNAMSESQMTCTPENYQPREKEVFLQKHGWNVLFTEEFKKMKQKYPHKVKDLLADASIKDDMRKERSYLFSVKAKRKRLTDDGAVEDVFYSEGLMWQIPNFYGIGSQFYLGDLIAINKLQFTDFATSSRAFTLMGKNFAERLENVDPGENRKIDFTNTNMFDLTFKTFKDTFGENHFIYDQAMDFMGLSDYALVLDLDNATHYFKEKQQRENDLSKGADPRLARRHMEWEADALALRGYNSIVVGPEGEMFSKMSQGIINWIISANTLPTTPSTNMKVALTSDYKSGETTYEKGKVYIYNGTAWVEYNGVDVAG